MNSGILGFLRSPKDLGFIRIRFGLGKKSWSKLRVAEEFRYRFGNLAAGEKKLENEPHLAEVFAGIVENQTAGSPMREKVRWTELKDSQIVRLFGEKGHSISRYMVKQLTVLAGLTKRQMKKTKTAKEVENRDEQFQKIAALKEDYRARGLPVLSIDTKKKEFIGQFYRHGKSYCAEAMSLCQMLWK